MTRKRHVNEQTVPHSNPDSLDALLTQEVTLKGELAGAFLDLVEAESAYAHLASQVERARDRAESARATFRRLSQAWLHQDGTCGTGQDKKEQTVPQEGQ